MTCRSHCLTTVYALPYISAPVHWIYTTYAHIYMHKILYPLTIIYVCMY